MIPPNLEKYHQGPRMFGKLLTGFGLMIMASAMAYFGHASDLATSSGADYGPIAGASFWIFIAGALVAILGSLTAVRR